MKKIFLISLILIFISFSYSYAGNGKKYIKGKIDYILQDAIPGNGVVGIYVKCLKTGEVVYDFNSNYPLTPASNMKLVITSASLSKLGQFFCFDTNLYGKNIGKGGCLESDLILYSNGDPTYCNHFYSSPTKTFEFMAQKLYSMGIRNIAGDLIADDTFFDREFTCKSWKKSYQFEPYSAQVSPICLNENVLDIKVYPGNGNKLPGVITLFPTAPVIKINNQTKTSNYEQTLQVTREEYSNNITVSGWIPKDSSCIESYITVHDPALYTASAFQHILKKNGITLSGTVRTVEATERDKRKDYNILCSHRSPFLPSIIAYVNKKSDNLTAEILLKTLGATYYGEGSSHNGIQAVNDFLEQAGIDNSGLSMVDGSGLSPENRVTAKLLSDILSYMYYSPNKKVFMDSLAIAGVDGTLKKRLRGTLAEGNVKAKTGSISGVSALSGYVTTSYGETIVFSILINDVEVWVAKDAEDRIVQALSSCSDSI